MHFFKGIEPFQKWCYPSPTYRRWETSTQNVKYIKQSIEKFLIYRATSLFVIIFSTIFSVIEIITTIVYFSYTDNIAGFNFYEFLILISTFNIIGTIYNILCINSHENLSDKILAGQLDYDLIRPVDSQIINNFSEFEISSIISSIVPIITFFYAARKINYISIMGGIFFIIFVMLGAYFYYLLNQFFVNFSFWIERPGKLLGIPEELFEFAAKPRRIYPKIFQIIFAWIIPIISTTNVPVELLTGKIYYKNISFYCFIIIVFSLVVRFQWNLGVKRYTSTN
ncbi:hypothetical protein CLTEP_18140 [Clostridium tepidiprofundi DSM 19306]|uniref:ABC-2 family transporter protein n=1 Tax=Clostridium tepidiprofundi DSM 19306 TaxID=1121338 RepID=A0A151B2S8_9CLOT|nr:ABC-2 family transporter protein [Clostridium tepidiprofundi]KYH34239.1 hypothetical protein CLTEP_18140 [Clostridium tepidiprofundi DSM 19306]